VCREDELGTLVSTDRVLLLGVSLSHF
jgi:hypothetical protein